MTIRKIVNASISLGEVTAISQDLALINLLITVVVEMQMLFKCIIISFLSLETFQLLNAAETGGAMRKWQPKTISESSVLKRG